MDKCAEFSDRSLGTASITNAGGVADIRSPRRLQTTGSDHEMRRAPAGATGWSSRDFRSPGRGSDSIFTTNRWFAPPANIQCPFGTSSSLSRTGRFEGEDFAIRFGQGKTVTNVPGLFCCIEKRWSTTALQNASEITVSEWRPRFGVRRCSAAFERTIHHCFVIAIAEFEVIPKAKQPRSFGPRLFITNLH